MDEYVHRVYFIINFNSSINGSNQRLIIEYKCRELYTVITKKEFDITKYTQTYLYNGTYYKWEFDIIGAKEILQQFVNDLINLWEKYKLHSITN